MLDFLLIESLGSAKNISDVTNDTIKCVSIFNWGVEKMEIKKFLVVISAISAIAVAGCSKQQSSQTKESSQSKVSSKKASKSKEKKKASSKSASSATSK